MKRWDAAKDGQIYRDIQALENPTLSLYALESYAIIVDNMIQEELFRKLVLSHAEIAGDLAESEKRLNEAQHIAHIGRWDIDHEHGLRSWSKSYQEILRLDVSVAPSRELFETFTLPEDQERLRQGYAKLLIEHESWDEQMRLQLRDGEIIWVHLRVQTEFDEKGKPRRSFSTMQDITQIKLAEEALSRYSKQLEEMVANKVREISEAQIATIFALVKLAESRDDETGAHIERTASFCRQGRPRASCSMSPACPESARSAAIRGGHYG